MTESVPKFIDPFSLIKQQAKLQGTVPVAALQRLSESLMTPDGEVAWTLRFRRMGSVAAITGNVAATLTLQCQCCLESLTWQVDAPINLGVVSSLDEANLLEEPYEPLLLTDSAQVCLLDIIEDEVILALPIIPQHAYACRAQTSAPGNVRLHPATDARPAKSSAQRAVPGLDEDDEPGGKNPFGVLAALRLKQPE
ncbi:MAG: hypothetical protein EPN21_03175 [Methylococcaceae bacterium]|nr:MAG: hypothetical protein EPN21_03175 [Methylococcaceae bacterium]